MIFKKLILKNFMSYSNSELDLSGIHTACLVGPNGAGKSSLLDAITWTIWEEGRARTDELVKLGRNEMSCELEFFMEDELFRVYRSRTKGLKNAQGKSNLEFQIFNPKEKNWISLSKTATRLTQDLIIKTLKMDYPTFVNSVYLRQGKADEFTVKRPGERKQILSDILGLGIYDELCDKSRLEIKKIEQEIINKQSLIQELEKTLQREEELTQNYKALQEKLSQEEEKSSKIKDLLSLKEKELNEKKEKERQIETLEKSKENQESLVSALEEQLKNIKEKKEKNKALVNQKDKIEKDYKDYLSLKEKLEDCEIKSSSYNKITLEKHNLEKKLSEKINELEKELAVYKSQISDRTSAKDKLLLKIKQEEKFFNDYLPGAKAELSEFKDLQDRLKDIELKGQDLKYKKDFLGLDLNKILEKKDEIIKKINTLNSHNHKEPCPLCKSPIKDKDKVLTLYKEEIKACEEKEKTLSEKIKEEENKIQEKRIEYQNIKEKISSFKEIIKRHLKELQEIRQDKIDSEPVEKTDTEKQVAFLTSQIEISKNDFTKVKEQVTVLDKEITSCREKIASVNDLLQSGNVIKQISGELNKIQKELEKLNYDSTLHESLKKDLRNKENTTHLYRELTLALSESPVLLKQEEDLTLKISSASCEIESLIKLISTNRLQIKDILSLKEEVEKLKDEEKEKTRTLEVVRKELILSEQELKEIEKSKKLVKEKEGLIEKSLTDKKYFEILEKAFSKNGIQIAIIETVVPELEKEANRILTRLTDNQMHVALRTQKEKKSQEGLSETLDVIIADSSGTRNYELYSGGEAFKIDFSLRLALSRLLANRAGARLQTLIIDEGFGSQDTSGKERLVEVIKSIEGEFELILVVTHLDEMKDSFPVQIQIVKDEEGSKVKIEG